MDERAAGNQIAYGSHTNGYEGIPYIHVFCIYVIFCDRFDMNDSK